MLSKIFIFMAIAAVVAANCGNVVSSRATNNVVSNKCRCVKTILRHVPVRSIVCKPTERREVQTFIRPVVQNVAFTVNTPPFSGPNVGIVGGYGYGYNNALGGNLFAGNNYSPLFGNNFDGLVGNTYGSSLISGTAVGNTYGCNTVC